MAGGLCPIRSNHCYFHCARRFTTSILAHMLDSLVRVSRRGKENHFASTTSTYVTSLSPPRTEQGITPKELPPDKHLPEATHADQRKPQRPTASGREIWRTQHWFPSLPFQQFQVLFNSLFKVLCIFPSRYLYAIGLPPIFSFRWNLPPTLSCNPKQLDSLKTYHGTNPRQEREFHPLCCPFPRDLVQNLGRCSLSRPQFGHRSVQIHMVSSSRFTRRY